jgi:hypothetical protein
VPSKRYQVFISSTFSDLEEERRLVYRQIQKLGHIPAGMEVFTAVDEPQFSYIQTVIDLSDYYVLIIGGRYGTLTERGISFTEAEFEYAVGKKVPILAFLHRNPETLPRKSADADRKLVKKLDAFREKVRGGEERMVEMWENPHELVANVVTSLSVAVARVPRVGWVRSDQVVTSKEALDVVLTSQYHALLRRYEELESERDALSRRYEELESERAHAQGPRSDAEAPHDQAIPSQPGSPNDRVVE